MLSDRPLRLSPMLRNAARERERGGHLVASTVRATSDALSNALRLHRRKDCVSYDRNDLDLKDLPSAPCLNLGQAMTLTLPCYAITHVRSACSL